MEALCCFQAGIALLLTATCHVDKQSLNVSLPAIMRGWVQFWAKHGFLHALLQLWNCCWLFCIVKVMSCKNSVCSEDTLQAVFGF